MADAADLDLQLVRQTRQHLEALRLAGVQWLSAAPELSTQRMPATATTPPTLPSLGTPTEPASVDGPLSNEDSGFFDQMPPSKPVGPVEERRASLLVLAKTVSGCTRCPELAASRTQTVFGVGRTGADLCFIGEAPGADEDVQGEPFVGAAGQLLNRIIAACQMSREDVYICNIIKCRPPGNRTPLPNEANNCREYLEKQLDLVQPKFICALGSTAAQNLLGTTLSIGKLRGRFHNYKGIPVIVTYHPAYLLPHRSPGSKKEVWEDMKMLLARMGRPVA